MITIWLYNHEDMNMSAAEQLDRTFLALADPTRRAILLRLSQGEASVHELAQPFALSQPAVSKHLKVLERAGLIRVGQDAQRRPRTLAALPLGQANAWLERFRDLWEQNYERLDALLDELQEPPKRRAPKKR
jgi:DNA-binding transcriptional ArsR family regulator